MADQIDAAVDAASVVAWTLRFTGNGPRAARALRWRWSIKSPARRDLAEGTTWTRRLTGGALKPARRVSGTIWSERRYGEDRARDAACDGPRSVQTVPCTDRSDRRGGAWDGVLLTPASAGRESRRRSPGGWMSAAGHVSARWHGRSAQHRYLAPHRARLHRTTPHRKNTHIAGMRHDFLPDHPLARPIHTYPQPPHAEPTASLAPS